MRSIFEISPMETRFDRREFVGYVEDTLPDKTRFLDFAVFDNDPGGALATLRRCIHILVVGTPPSHNLHWKRGMICREIEKNVYEASASLAMSPYNPFKES